MSAGGHPARTSLGRESMDSSVRNFSVGDPVWAKVQGFPWWPGQIYDPALQEKFKKYQRLDGFLVAFFGDGTFYWCKRNELLPFEEHFEEKTESKTVNAAFFTAVDEAMEHIWKMTFQTGERAEGNTSEEWVEPADALSYLKAVAAGGTAAGSKAASFKALRFLKEFKDSTACDVEAGIESGTPESLGKKSRNRSRKVDKERLNIQPELQLDDSKGSKPDISATAAEETPEVDRVEESTEQMADTEKPAWIICLPADENRKRHKVRKVKQEVKTRSLEEVLVKKKRGRPKGSTKLKLGLTERGAAEVALEKTEKQESGTAPKDVEDHLLQGGFMNDKTAVERDVIKVKKRIGRPPGKGKAAGFKGKEKLTRLQGQAESEMNPLFEKNIQRAKSVSFRGPNGEVPDTQNARANARHEEQGGGGIVKPEQESVPKEEMRIKTSALEKSGDFRQKQMASVQAPSKKEDHGRHDSAQSVELGGADGKVLVEKTVQLPGPGDGGKASREKSVHFSELHKAGCKVSSKPEATSVRKIPLEMRKPGAASGKKRLLESMVPKVAKKARLETNPEAVAHYLNLRQLARNPLAQHGPKLQGLMNFILKHRARSSKWGPSGSKDMKKASRDLVTIGDASEVADRERGAVNGEAKDGPPEISARDDGHAAQASQREVNRESVKQASRLGRQLEMAAKLGRKRRVESSDEDDGDDSSPPDGDDWMDTQTRVKKVKEAKVSSQAGHLARKAPPAKGVKPEKFTKATAGRSKDSGLSLKAGRLGERMPEKKGLAFMSTSRFGVDEVGRGRVLDRKLSFNARQGLEIASRLPQPASGGQRPGEGSAARRDTERSHWNSLGSRGRENGGRDSGGGGSLGEKAARGRDWGEDAIRARDGNGAGASSAPGAATVLRMLFPMGAAFPSEKELAAQFVKFGRLHDDRARCFPTRRCALVIFQRLEDACVARDEINKKGYQQVDVKVDVCEYVQPARKIGGSSRSPASRQARTTGRSFQTTPPDLPKQTVTGVTVEGQRSQPSPKADSTATQFPEPQNLAQGPKHPPKQQLAAIMPPPLQSNSQPSQPPGFGPSPQSQSQYGRQPPETAPSQPSMYPPNPQKLPPPTAWAPGLDHQQHQPPKQGGDRAWAPTASMPHSRLLTSSAPGAVQIGGSPSPMGFPPGFGPSPSAGSGPPGFAGAVATNAFAGNTPSPNALPAPGRAWGQPAAPMSSPTPRPHGSEPRPIQTHQQAVSMLPVLESSYNGGGIQAPGPRPVQAAVPEKAIPAAPVAPPLPAMPPPPATVAAAAEASGIIQEAGKLTQSVPTEKSTVTDISSQLFTLLQQVQTLVTGNSSSRL